jgi:signal transduction histidine kinase
MRGWLNGFSIRARITAWTLALGLVVSVVAGVLLYLDVSSIIHSSTVQLLHNDLTSIEVVIKHSPREPDTRAGEGQLVATVDPTGRVVTSNLPDSLRDRFSELRRLSDDATEVGSGSRDYLVVAETVETSAGPWSVIAARSLQPGQLVLRKLITSLLVGAAVLFVTFGVTSWVLSGAALRPVSRMRKEAERLGNDDTVGMLPVGSARDELAALAVTLNEFLERNRQSIERERQMLSDASHELRTPVAVLVAQLAEAKRLDQSAEQSREIANAANTVARLSRLTTNMLELSQLDAPHEAATSTWRELMQELSASTDRARILAHPKSISVDFEVTDGNDGDRFGVTAVNFGRLADNLFMNSIVASSRGTAVHASLAMADAELVLMVRDEGTGMPEEFIPNAFDRFSRAETSRSTRDGGSGLGLAIVAAIVARAGGRIDLRNLHPGLGVYVALPART